MFIKFIRFIVRCSWKAVFIYILAFGLFFIAESACEKSIPKFHSYIGNRDPKMVSNSHLVSNGKIDRWEGLQPALEILDSVNPDVKNWVIECRNSEKLVFVESFDKTTAVNAHFHICKYDLFERKLIIYKGIFAENDGTIAALLCHEYRHSRQSFFKILRYAFSFCFYKDGNDDIVENDAELYERNAYNIIFKLEYPFEVYE